MSRWDEEKKPRNRKNYAVVAVLLILLLTPNSGFGMKLKGAGGAVRDPNSKDVVLYKGSYALVIGVSDYDEWPDLRNVPKEIVNVEKALASQGFKVRSVLNPDGEKMHQELRKFFKQYGLDKDNRLLLFFSGHGYSYPEKQEGFLIPADAPNPDPWEKEKSYKSIKRKSISMEEIKFFSKEIQAKHLLVVFDSCFSGSIFLKKSASYATLDLSPDIEVLADNPVRQFLTAGDENQQLPGKSIFTPLFISGINGSADIDNDDFVTGTELYLYLRKEISRYNPDQTPEEDRYSPEPGAVKGDFIFTYKKDSIFPPSNDLHPSFSLHNQAGLAVGYTRFEKADHMNYLLVGLVYTRSFHYGDLGLTFMTSLNPARELRTADPEVKFGRAVSISAGYTYPISLGLGVDFLAAVGYERLEVDLEIGGHSDKLIKNNCLVGGGFRFGYHRVFVEARANYIWGEDKNLGNDINALLSVGIKF